MSAESWQVWSRATVNLLTGVGLTVIFLGIPLSYLIVKRIVRPLNELGEAMAAFASGYLDVRSPVDRRDEIGRLARAFNGMASQHQLVHDNLIKLNGELEVRVARRTKQLRHLASRDPLTGLYNRRYFDEMLRRRFMEAKRYGSTLACVMIDVDNFKQINDQRGHQAGDRMLNLVASIIERQLRGADVGARYGGDKFVLLLPHTNVQQAETLAQRLRSEFCAAQMKDPSHPPATLSIGIADSSDPDLTDSEGLLRAADRGMYRAKTAGKDRVTAGSTDPAPLGA